MTSGGNQEEGVPEEALEAAKNDLGRVREHLQAAAQGETDAQELKDAVEGYWREHEPVLRAAAASLTEEVRLQALEELYKWRERLNAQLQPGPGTATESTGQGEQAPERSSTTQRDDDGGQASPGPSPR